MKSLQYILGAFLIIASAVACKKSEIKTYDGKISVYFPRSLSSPYLDTLAVTFTFAPLSTTDSLIKIPVRIAGEPVDKDRVYNLVINPNKTTAVAGSDYKLNDKRQFVIPAGKVTDTIYLDLLRTPALLTEQKAVSFTLLPNENFQTDILFKVVNTITGQRVSNVDYTVSFNDILRKPGRWLDGYLGAFSRKKAFLMIELMGMDLAYLDNAAAVSDIIYYGKFMQRYLNEKKALGETVYEADNVTPMVMGPSVQ